MASNPESGHWQTIDQCTVYDNHWLQVSHQNVVTPAGSPGIYGVVRYKHLAVGVLAVDTDRTLVLVGQYRYPLQQYSWEIPEGGCRLKAYCEKGEAELAEQCARRELLEETGIAAAGLQPFLEMSLSNSISDERAVVFLATGLSDADASCIQREASEADMQVKKVSFDQALAMIASGEIHDAITVASIYKYLASDR